MTTNNLQAELPGMEGAQRRPQPLDIQTLCNKRTFLAALKYVIQCGNFDYDKQIYQPLGIDPGNWTRIMNGSASFPQDKEDELQELCGNIGLAIWRAYRKGFRLEPLQDSKDKLIAELQAKNAELLNEIQTLIKYGVIRKP